jgi:hypothetical protein
MSRCPRALDPQGQAVPVEHQRPDPRDTLGNTRVGLPYEFGQDVGVRGLQVRQQAGLEPGERVRARLGEGSQADAVGLLVEVEPCLVGQEMSEQAHVRFGGEQ